MQKFFIGLLLRKAHHHVTHRVHDISLIIPDAGIISYVIAEYFDNGFSITIPFDDIRYLEWGIQGWR